MASSRESAVAAVTRSRTAQAIGSRRPIAIASPGASSTAWEPVIRLGVVGGTDKMDQDQLAVGLNYWLFESAPIKLTYEFNSGELDKDRFLVQFAYGF